MGGASVTVTVTDCVAESVSALLPHWIVNSVVVESGPVDCVPLGGRFPLQPPEAVQKSAFADVQVRSVCAPPEIVVAPAVKLTVGEADRAITCVDAVVDPPVPVQLTEKVVFCMIAGVSMMPLVGCGPVIPLVPTH
jgi:hypothetical protein